jgi:PAS domain S-box-containing protein
MINLRQEVRSIIRSHGTDKNLLLSLIDKEGTVYSVNAGFRRVLGIRPVRKTRINFFDFVSKEEGYKFRNTLGLSEKQNGFHQANLVVKNGHLHSLHLTVHPVVSRQSCKSLFLCIGKEAKSQEPDLSPHPNLGYPLNLSTPIHTTNIFRDTLEKMPVLAWMINEEEELVFANESFRQYFDLPPNALNRDIRSVIPKKIIDSLYDKHVSVLDENKTVTSFEKAFLMDGTNISFQLTLFPVFDDKGAKFISGQAIMVKNQGELEKQLKEANENLLLISRATSDAIWEWDMRTGDVFRNEALMAMIGFGIKKSIGLAWWLRHIHPEDRNRVSDKVKQATDLGHLSWEDEYRFKCADGGYKNIHDRGFIVYENGLPVKMIGSLQDVSKIKQLQGLLDKEKHDRRQELTETVISVQERERTRIGYELHDNINQILSTSKLFIEAIHPEDHGQKAAKAKSIEYLMMAIEEIRSLSKELVLPQLKQEKLTESIQSMIDDINVCKEIMVKFTYDREPDLLSAGKKTAIYRIVQEQVKNILKYSKAGRAEIVLENTEEEIMLMIKDDGVGFDYRQTRRGIGISSIFERAKFYNGSASINTSPGNGCSLNVQIPFNG